MSERPANVPYLSTAEDWQASALWMQRQRDAAWNELRRIRIAVNEINPADAASASFKDRILAILDEGRP